MTTKRRVLVTGATGQQGGAVARALLSGGHSVKALTRKPDSDAARQLKSEGADVVVGDLGDATSILRAAGDVDTMFLMGNSYEAGVEEEIRQGIIAADAAKAADVGHFNRVRSSRRLEAACHRNIEVIWLLRTLKPDFKTIADFRSDNRAAFRAVFRQFTLLCRELNLFGRELLAVDGTRIKAVNNKDRNFTKNSLEKFIKAVDKRLDEYLRRLDESDVEEAATDGSRTKNLAEKIEALREKRERFGALLTELEGSGESQISLTDPDSRAMAAHTKVAVGYNIQVAVDAKNKLIVDQEVTNQVVDMGLLTQTAEPARAILEVETIDVVADRGYFKIEDIEACEKARMTPYVPSHNGDHR